MWSNIEVISISVYRITFFITRRCICKTLVTVKIALGIHKVYSRQIPVAKIVLVLSYFALLPLVGKISCPFPILSNEPDFLNRLLVYFCKLYS